MRNDDLCDSLLDGFLDVGGGIHGSYTAAMRERMGTEEDRRLSETDLGRDSSTDREASQFELNGQISNK